MPSGGGHIIRAGFETPGTLATMVVATIALSFLSYRLVEQGEFWRRQRLVLSGLVAVVVIIVAWAPLEILNRAGFSERQLHAFDARDDGYENRCGKLFRLLHPTERVCAITRADTGGTILLIGNSHADAIKSAFAETARGRATFLFYTDVGVLFGRIGVHEIVEDVRRMGVTELVLHYSNGYSSASRRATLRRLVEALDGTGVRISVIAPVPTYGRHVPQMLYEASIGQGAPEIRTPAEHEEAIREFRGFERGLSDSSVRFFDPVPLLCAEGRCRIETKDGRPFYFDRMHQTRAAARELAPIFEEIVAGATPLTGTAPSN